MSRPGGLHLNVSVALGLWLLFGVAGCGAGDKGQQSVRNDTRGVDDVPSPAAAAPAGPGERVAPANTAALDSASRGSEGAVRETPPVETSAPVSQPVRQSRDKSAEFPAVPEQVLPAPKERQAAPELTLRDMSGREVTLSSLRGSVTMLVFWATWCRPCNMEVPHLVRLYDTYAKSGLNILAISLDRGGLATVKPYLDKRPEIKYTVIPSGEAAAVAFGGIRNIPNSFLLDRQGRVVKQFVGLAPPEVMEGFVQAALREKI